MKSKYLAVLGLTLALAGGGGGAWLASQRQAHRHVPEKRTTPEGKVYWTCVMHPQVRQDGPGSCPICGMKLVERGEAPPAAADAPAAPAAARDGVVEIDPRMLQNLGLRTARVERAGFTTGIDAVGSVAVDERRLVAVISRTPGFVERLDVHAVGEAVQRGQVIAGVYSPELYAAQQEFALVAARDPQLAAAAGSRLSLLGLSPAQIGQIARGGRAQRQALITAPLSGVITGLSVHLGSQTQPGTPIASIADLSSVWILVDLPEAQAGAVAVGDTAQARFTAWPGRSFAGRVDYLYPSVDSATRTRRARLVFDNAAGELAPGMFARVSLAGGAPRSRLLVPTEAVIRSGRRDVAIVALGGGRFRVAPLRIGDERDGRTEILEGLDAGAEVVTSGQFLIDSEASLRGVFGRIQGAAAPPPHEAHPAPAP